MFNMLNPSQATKEKMQVGFFSAIGGAVGIMVLGSFWPGWNLASTTQERVGESVRAAQVELLAPQCAEQFIAQSDFSMRRIALAKSSYWNRANQFEDNEEWVTLPGGTGPDAQLVQRCAALVLETSAKTAEAN